MRTVKKHQGVALIVALVILVPLTLIAVVVMQSSGMSLKMASSSASLQRAEHEVEGTLESALGDSLSQHKLQRRLLALQLQSVRPLLRPL